MFSHLRANAQCILQAAAVVAHALGEVSVAPVHRTHPFLQLGHMHMALLHKVVSQLNQQLHLILGLLRDTMCSI